MLNDLSIYLASDEQVYLVTVGDSEEGQMPAIVGDSKQIMPIDPLAKAFLLPFGCTDLLVP